MRADVLALHVDAGAEHNSGNAATPALALEIEAFPETVPMIGSEIIQ